MYFLNKISIMITLISLIATGCATQQYSSSVIQKKGTMKPYTIGGKQYIPLRSGLHYNETGLASWYGNPFHGKKTANGEIYDMFKATAAHKTLPMNTYVKVTRVDNNRSVIVRINDRGPFVHGRIIDLSLAAAKSIGIDKQGKTMVHIEALGKKAGNRLIKTDYRKGNFVVQAGAFKKIENAVKFKEFLKLNFQEVTIKQVTINNITFFRVRIGSFKRLSEAQKIIRKLKNRENINAFAVAE